LPPPPPSIARAPTFAKPPAGATHAAVAPKVGTVAEVNYGEEESSTEKLPLALLDTLSLVASFAFATLLILYYLSLTGSYVPNSPYGF
jgi:hypothetical protein